MHLACQSYLVERVSWGRQLATDSLARPQSVYISRYPWISLTFALLCQYSCPITPRSLFVYFSSLRYHGVRLETLQLGWN